jgi:hypothetical protein
MTVIASFGIRRHPVMLGDLLLSGPEPDKQILRVPSIGPVTNVFPNGSGYTLTGLKQKLAVIHPDLAMAWSGSYVKARFVANELKQLTSNKEFNLDSISRFVEEVREDSTLQDLSMIVLASDRKAGLVHTGSVRVQGYTTDHYGKVCVGGSGHDDIVSLLKGAEQSEFAKEKESEKNRVNLALNYAGYVAGTILTSDISTKHSLLQYYGGGSEIVTLIGGSFAKVDKLAYVVWFAHVVEPKQIRMYDPIRIMYYSYRKDYLFLHSMGFDPNLDREHRMVDNTQYLIDPIYKSNKLNAKAEFERERNYEPIHFVHIIQVADVSGERLIGQSYYIGSQVSIPDIKINLEQKGKITLTYKKDLLKTIIKQAYNLVHSEESHSE